VEVYHDLIQVSMPCSRNLADARHLRDENAVLVRLNDTTRIVGYGVVPIVVYAERYIWRPNSRLRGR
jgi:L-alanine-DL-glutamate epimerase-like enolase superfamily enzyme